jgi:hypothetical protein
MARACPKGYILRKAYSRKSYTNKSGVRVVGSKVPATCIKDRGLPGKGKKLFVLRKGTLGKHGYKTSFSANVRRAALRKAVKAESYAAVIRKLNAVSILQRRTNPKVYKIFRSDLSWVQKNLG